MFVSSIPLAHAQTSTWNPSTGNDSYEDTANWDPPGLPVTMSELRFEQIEGMTLTPIKTSEDHANRSITVFDPHVILNLQTHRLTLLSSNQEVKFASIVVGGASGPGGPSTLEIHDGVLEGNHAYVGKGRPGELGPLPPYLPSISVQAGAALLLNNDLWVGYGESNISKDRPGRVYIAGTARSNGVFVYAGSDFAVINGGTLQASDRLVVDPGSKFHIGRPEGTDYPMAMVSAKLVSLRGAVTIDFGTLAGQVEVNATRDLVMVTHGSKITTNIGKIGGFPPTAAHVTVSDEDSLWSSADALYVGGTESAASGGGTLTVSANGSATAGNQIKIWPPGRIELSDGNLSAPNIVLEGVLCGNGTITGNITNNGGTIEPGCSVGKLHLTGSYSQNQDGKLHIEIEGTNTGDYDVFEVDGNVALSGTLSITVPDDFPGDSSSFPIIKANSVTGSFDNVVVSSGTSADVTVTAEGVQIQLLPPTPPQRMMYLAAAIIILVIIGIFLFRRRS